MTLSKLLVTLIFIGLLFPFSVVAQDFGGDDPFAEDSGGDNPFAEDSGGGGEDPFADEDEDKKKEDPFSAEEEKKKEEDKEKARSDQALQDLGFGSEEKKKDDFSSQPPAEDSFGYSPAEDSGIESPKDDFSAPARPKKKTALGSLPVKPVAIIRGGFNYGVYKQGSGTGAAATTSNLGKAFGSLDDAIIGAEYTGDAVFAKGTLNFRTANPFTGSSIVYNPLISDNYTNGGNYAYEVYGGMKLFDMIFLKAGQMIPAYGILDEYQDLGLEIGTPFGTRALSVVEGIVPETDAGIAAGLDYGLTDSSGIKAEFMAGSGKIGNAFSNWDWDKTYAMYVRAGYYSDMITGYASLQYRNDYLKNANTGNAGKTFATLTFGVHAKFAWKGIMTNFSFDYNQFKTILQEGSLYNKKIKGNMLIHVMPGYELNFRNFGIDAGVIEALQLGIRFDVVQGIYNKPTAVYYQAADFDKSKMYIRFGTGLNVFASEVAGVRSFFGVSLMMQPETELVDKSKNYGFTDIFIQGGAQF